MRLKTYNELRKEAELTPHRGSIGVISASQLDAVEHCVGRHLRTLGMQSAPSEYALEGSTKHLAAEYGVCPEDAPDDFKYDVEFLLKRIKTFEDLGWRIVEKEKYMELKDNGEVILTGTCDLIMNKGISYLYVDYKTGKVPVEQDCLQLKAYAVMGQQYFNKANENYIMVWQPCCPENEPHMVKAHEDKERILTILKKAYDGGACTPNIISCKYCPAMVSEMCPAAQKKWVDDIATIPSTVELDPNKFSDYLEKVAFIEPICKEIKRQAYNHALKGNKIDGYNLVKPIKYKTVISTTNAYKACKDDIPLDEFLEHATIPYNAFRNFIMEDGMSKEQADSKLEELIPGNFKITERSGYLRRGRRK